MAKSWYSLWALFAIADASATGPSNAELEGLLGESLDFGRLYVQNLPRDIEKKHLAKFIWSWTGVWVEPEDIFCC